MLTSTVMTERMMPNGGALTKATMRNGQARVYISSKVSTSCAQGKGNGVSARHLQPRTWFFNSDVGSSLAMISEQRISAMVIANFENLHQQQRENQLRSGKGKRRVGQAPANTVHQCSC